MDCGKYLFLYKMPVDVFGRTDANNSTRVISGGVTLSQVNNTFLRKEGDTMTGDLYLNVGTDLSRTLGCDDLRGTKGFNILLGNILSFNNFKTLQRAIFLHIILHRINISGNLVCNISCQLRITVKDSHFNSHIICPFETDIAVVPVI